MPELQVYTDLITGDEMISSFFPIREVDNIVYEVDCLDVIVRTTVDDPEAMDNEGTKTVNNVVDAFKLKQTAAITKRAYLTYLNAYLKRVKTHLALDQVEEFEKNANLYAKKIIAAFPDYDFYTGQSMNADGMIALLRTRDDGYTPYFTFWKHGLKPTTLE